MVSIRVPKQHQNALAKILSLPEDGFQTLIGDLKSAPLAFDLRATLTKAVKSTGAFSSNDAHLVAGALRSLYLARANTELSETDFIDGLVKAINESLSEELVQAVESNEQIKQRLIQIFEAETLALVAKAGSVMTDYQNTFFKARVLTDIRPVFGEVPEATQAMMIVHNLKIHYHQGEEHRDFYVALDAKDIQKMIDALERAKGKAEALKSILANTNVAYIEPE
jgi:hypothetical protein